MIMSRCWHVINWNSTKSLPWQKCTVERLQSVGETFGRKIWKKHKSQRSLIWQLNTKCSFSSSLESPHWMYDTRIYDFAFEIRKLRHKVFCWNNIRQNFLLITSNNFHRNSKYGFSFHHFENVEAKLFLLNCGLLNRNSYCVENSLELQIIWWWICKKIVQ